MKRVKNKNAPMLFGPDKLTGDQIMKLPKKKGNEYIRNLTAEEKGDFFTEGMIENINAKHKTKFYVEYGTGEREVIEAEKFSDAVEIVNKKAKALKTSVTIE